MVNRGDNIWVVYPEYLDLACSRREGRKVSRKYALNNPKREELEAAARDLKLFLYWEEAPHPGHWHRKRGRIVVRKEIPKIMTLKALSRVILDQRREQKKMKGKGKGKK